MVAKHVVAADLEPGTRIEHFVGGPARSANQVRWTIDLTSKAAALLVGDHHDLAGHEMSAVGSW